MVLSFPMLQEDFRSSLNLMRDLERITFDKLLAFSFSSHFFKNKAIIPYRGVILRYNCFGLYFRFLGDRGVILITCFGAFCCISFFFWNQNIKVDPLTHQVKICDFGSAKVLFEAAVLYPGMRPTVLRICPR